MPGVASVSYDSYPCPTVVLSARTIRAERLDACMLHAWIRRVGYLSIFPVWCRSPHTVRTRPLPLQSHHFLTTSYPSLLTVICHFGHSLRLMPLFSHRQNSCADARLHIPRELFAIAVGIICDHTFRPKFGSQRHSPLQRSGVRVQFFKMQQSSAYSSKGSFQFINALTSRTIFGTCRRCLYRSFCIWTTDSNRLFLWNLRWVPLGNLGSCRPQPECLSAARIKTTGWALVHIPKR